jgi:hypothetical protein
MWMIEYIAAIQRQFIDVYGFKEDPEKKGVPLNVPDGEYPMKIDGKIDRVKIKDGHIHCCNFDRVPPPKTRKFQEAKAAQ